MGVIREYEDAESEVEYLPIPTKTFTALKPPKSQEDEHQFKNLTTILAGVGAAAGVLIVVILVLCAVFLRRRRKKRKSIASKYDKIFTTLRRPSPFSASSNSSSSPSSHLNSRDERRSVYNALDLVSTKPQIDKQIDLKLYGSTTERRVSMNNDKLARYHSFEEQTERKGPRPLKKSKSAASLVPLGAAGQQEVEQTISVSFNLKYVPKLRQLHLKLLGVFDLPVKTYGYDINATVFLFPRNTEGVHSRYMRGGKDVQLHETFLFDDMTLGEVEKATMRLVLNYRKKTKMAKEGFLGELFVKCCDVDWSSERPVKFVSTLMKSREKNGSTVEKYLLEDLGALLVCLEYQQTANRMKVLVRRGSDFPKSDKLIGRPGHYVRITLLKNREVVKVQDTRSHSGNSPIWNQPFLFDVTGDDVSVYSLDFVIMREKLHTKDAVVGHVLIGENGSKSGRVHWKDVLSPRPNESAKWHSILPVIHYKESHQGE